jgi:potassium efflux system protein
VIVRRILFSILLVLSSAIIAVAQDVSSDNDRDALIQRAEEALVSGAASAEALSILRKDLMRVVLRHA